MDLSKSQTISPALPYVDFTNELDIPLPNVRYRSSSVPRPLHIPTGREHIAEVKTAAQTSNYFTGTTISPCFSPKSPRSPRSPRSPITIQRSTRVPPRMVSSPRYPTSSQLSPLPTIHHSPDQSSRGSSSNSNRNLDDSSNRTLHSPHSSSMQVNYADPHSHSRRFFITTGNPPVAPTGHLAMLAARRRSVATQGGFNNCKIRRPSNFLELPGIS